MNDEYQRGDISGDNGDVEKIQENKKIKYSHEPDEKMR